MDNNIRLILILFICIWRCAFAAEYSPGADDTQIKLGNTTAYSGPASHYSLIAKTSAAYFNKINEEGGINGRKIIFLSRDDNYSPAKTLEQARRLVENDEVLAIVEPLGTPTNKAIQKYLNEKKIPQLFIISGTEQWNKPQLFPWSMRWLPSYYDEGRSYAKYLLQNIPNAKIGVLYQNDDYGKEFFNGFRDALGDKADKMIVKVQTYDVRDPTINSQIFSLKKSGADVFLDISTCRFSVQAIQKMADIDWKPTHILNSVSASLETTFQSAGLEESTGIITMQCLKGPLDPVWKDDKGVKDYLAFMEKYMPDANANEYFSVLGYTVAQTIVRVLEQCKDNITRDNVMTQAASLDLALPMLLPGIKLRTSKNDFAPIKQYQMVKFDGSKFISLGSIINVGQD